MRLKLKRQRVPITKIEIRVLKLTGGKYLKGRSISVYETTVEKVYDVLHKALEKAAQ